MDLKDLTPLTSGTVVCNSARTFQSGDAVAVQNLPLHMRHHLSSSIVGVACGDREAIDNLSVCLMFGVNDSSLAESVGYAWGEESEVIDQLGLKQYSQINRVLSKISE